MKYLTKDWYVKMQHTSLHLFLKVDKRAEEFSEDFYQEIYNEWKKEQIQFLEDIIDYNKFQQTFLKNFKLQFESQFGRELTEEDIQSEFKRINEQTFGGMSIDEYFCLLQENLIKEVKFSLPEDILVKVKDIRVLAHNYVSSEVYDLIRKYCEDNKNFVDDKSSEYSKIKSEQFENESIDYIKESFHDCNILDIIKDDKDCVIKLDNSDAFTSKTKIIFKNYNIILDENIKNYCWKYSEIYKNKQKYEVHILTMANMFDINSSFRDCLRELILQCDDIIVE